MFTLYKKQMCKNKSTQGSKINALVLRQSPSIQQKTAGMLMRTLISNTQLAMVDQFDKNKKKHSSIALLHQSINQTAL